MSDLVEWIRTNLWAAWGVAALGLAAAELLTLDLTLLMVAGGALAGGLVALIFPALVWLQITVAVVTAIATLFLLRPTLLARVRNAPGYRSSLDSLVGSTGIATGTVTAVGGSVKVDGQDWEARSFDPAVLIEPGEPIEVFGLEGITLIVYPLSRPLTS
ncbi:NfeD family protein [Tessaracoccus sp. HDW20]|uniref:NfeD family protein n=1 Tax=Tessaracoccus coleopterorum TaxID=2714950 RepID=UPI0018D460FE|nr:NfeD family protein [Tessaracoccus coleopterorum]NHB83893.1 NfeD family protein [Tessaracoccus coleopterorum]